MSQAKARTWYIISILFLMNSASAINDINISIDNMGLDVCLMSNLTYQTCDLKYITLNGVQDHQLYFTPKKFIGDGVDQNTTTRFFLTDPVEMMISGSYALVGIALMCFAVYFMGRFVSSANQ